MTASGHISYYCFNKACKGSVYFSSSVRIKELPFTAHNLSREHVCSLCRSKLISAYDVELKKMLYKKQVAAAPYKHPIGV